MRAGNLQQLAQTMSTGCTKRIATFAAMPRRLGRQLPRSHARRHPWMPPGCPAHIELCRDAVHSQLLGKFQSARGLSKAMRGGRDESRGGQDALGRRTPLIKSPPDPG